MLVGLDVSVEEAELQGAAGAGGAGGNAVRAHAAHDQDSARPPKWKSTRARAERDVALAQIARIEAIIERKTIRAPFRARVGISDVHPGQYLNEGTLLTTLQGVDDQLRRLLGRAAGRRRLCGQAIRSGVRSATVEPITAAILAIDARVDPATRNATVRAQDLRRQELAPTPGASVRVQVPVGAARVAVVIPASALRKGPAAIMYSSSPRMRTARLRAESRQVQVDSDDGR